MRRKRRCSPWIKFALACLLVPLTVLFCQSRQPDAPTATLGDSNTISEKIDSLTVDPPATIIANVPPFGNKPPKRVVLLGWDGATWKIISHMLAAGEMPNLRRLLAYGAAGVLQTDVAVSPISWTTIATGKSREHHGIGASVGGPQKTNRQEELKYFDPTLTSDNVAARQIWDMFPAERFPQRAVFSYYMPPSFARWRGLIYNEGVLFAPGPVQELCDEGDTDKDIICLLANAPYDVAFSIINAADAVGHEHYFDYLLQALLENGEIELAPAYAEKIRAGADEMKNAYRLLDRSIEPFLNKPDTLVAIVSDHGMQAATENRNELFLMADFFAEFGAQVIDYDPHKPFTFDARVDKQTARITVQPVLASYPIGRWLPNDETLHLDVVAPSFACRSSLGNGCPRAVKEKLVSTLATFQVRDRPLYDDGIKTDRGLLFAPRGDSLTAVSQASNAGGNKFCFFIHFQGDHTEGTPGIFILAGPGVKPGARFAGANLMDVTPTILALSGLPIADDFDGRVLIDAIKPAYLAAHPLTSVDTYGTRDTSQVKTPMLTLEQRRRLRELGYLN
ncbi:MAG TPA: alkaline phosphatase family protein [bacterium]|nr:alkaline phosphatase family protein [bacterium]